MCELLGMSANVPTDICFSFAGLIQRGGATGPHRDGWGVAFYEGAGYRAFHDPVASVDSEIAQFIQQYSIKSTKVICHIRKANRGRICLENTHPFSRELWGQAWSFAHNGQLKGIKKRGLNFYHPTGSTDSEYAFCWLLDQIRSRFPSPPKNRRKLFTLIKALCEDLAELGVFNILMSDSKVLYAHCSSKLHWLTRRAPFGDAQLVDADMEINFANETSPEDIVTVIATRPLTHNETWNKMARHELQIFCSGEQITPQLIQKGSKAL